MEHQNVGPRKSQIGKMAIRSLIACTLLSMGISAAGTTKSDSISAELLRFLNADSNKSCGILFGRLNGIDSVPQVWTAGGIEKESDLRLGCPTAKPLLAYLTLKEGIALDATIDHWFPEVSGFTNSHAITIRNLLSNMSGIRDYVPLVPMNPDSSITPENSIDRAYRNQALLFEPGAGFEYSNTNFNMIGLILEARTGKTVSQLFQETFRRYAPSLRLDDGKGNYPVGYAKPWPYHWSAPGFAGGFIGSAADAMRVFCFVSSEPQFARMTAWLTPTGSDPNTPSNNLIGLGVFGKRNFAGCGQAVAYEGNMGPCQMILARVSGSVFYISSAHQVELPKLSELFQRLIAISLH
jgi:hypothetical protein